MAGTGTATVRPCPCVYVCPHILGAMPKANHMAPTPILEAHVTMLTWVTGIQNKFYLLLLYPEKKGYFKPSLFFFKKGMSKVLRIK